MFSRRLKAAFPKNKYVIPGFLAAYLLLLSPTLLYPFDPQAFRSMRAEDGMAWIIPAYILVFSMIGYFLWIAVVDLPVGVSRMLKKLSNLPGKEVDESRRRFLAKAALAPPVAALTASCAGSVVAFSDPVVTTLKLPAKPEFGALKGLKIVQFSDVHVGRFTTDERLTEIANAVNAQQPHIIVCTGDLFDNDFDGQREQSARFLNQMRAPYGQYLCLGNHEYYAASSLRIHELIKVVDEAGFTVLKDAHVKIEHNDAHMYLLGVDYPGYRQPHVSFAEALKGIPEDGAPRVALAHSPISWGAGKNFPIDLTLCGHTHGGQISAGRIGDLELSPAVAIESYVRGEYEHDGKRLYVNSGTGSWMPVRLNVPPEITVVELT
jgi:predicted MPP superfamily phosphohydrolase